MWIIVATVLLLYLLGFLFICFLNAENHGNPSSVDNNSLSASTNHDETENFCQRHHLGRYHRLFLNRLLSTNFRFDEEEAGEANRLQAQSQTSGGRQGQTSSDPSRSALFAHRQQQLRQIHHEINEMSHLLGARQSQSVQQSGTAPVPIFSRANLVQPLRNFGSSSNYSNVYSRANCSRYSFVHQLMSPPQSPHSSTTTRTSVTTGESAIMSSNPGTDTNNVSNSNSSICTPGGSITYHSCGSSSLSYSPSGSESCHIFQARQRRLRDIRMELEGLSLQLSHVDDRSAGGIIGMSPPHVDLHHNRTTQANDTSNLLSRVAAPSSELNSESNNNVSATDSSLLHHNQMYSQSHHRHHPHVVIPQSSIPTVTNTPTSSFPTRTTANMDVTVADSNTPTSYNSITNSNAIPSSFPHENDAIITPHVVPVNHGDDDYHHHPPYHENNSTSETASPGNHYPQHHHHHYQNENFPCLSDFLFNSNCIRSQALAQQRQHQQQLVACGIVARAIDSSRPRRSQCACNLCYSAASNIGTRARRMLMLRRMLLPTFPMTFPIDTITNANVTTSDAATTTQRDFLARPVGPSACDVHYGREEREHHLHDSQPGFSDYSHQPQQQHGDRQQNQRENDDPPPYEECIRSDRRSQEGNDHNQNLYSNNNVVTCNTICDNNEERADNRSISTQA